MGLPRPDGALVDAVALFVREGWPEADAPLSRDALAAEPGAAGSVVEIGPAAMLPVSDVCAPAATALGAALLLFAAEAEPAPPLQAAARMMIETRTQRYIFPSYCQR